MRKMITIILSFGFIFGLPLLDVDVAGAGGHGSNGHYNNCDLSGLWILEMDPTSPDDPATAMQATMFATPLDRFKRKYAAPIKFIQPPLMDDLGIDTVIPVGGIAERTSRCIYDSTGYWYGLFEGVRVMDIVIHGKWILEDPNTAIHTSVFKFDLPDGTYLFCGPESDITFRRLNMLPYSDCLD